MHFEVICHCWYVLIDVVEKCMEFGKRNQQMRNLNQLKSARIAFWQIYLLICHFNILWLHINFILSLDRPSQMNSSWWNLSLRGCFRSGWFLFLINKNIINIDIININVALTKLNFTNYHTERKAVR